MVTPVALVTGLGGAIGCDYRRSHSELIFVEFAGNLSRLDLIRSLNSIVSSGAGILHGTFLFDFDTGTEGRSFASADRKRTQAWCRLSLHTTLHALYPDLTTTGDRALVRRNRGRVDVQPAQGPVRVVPRAVRVVGPCRMGDPTVERQPRVVTVVDVVPRVVRVRRARADLDVRGERLPPVCAERSPELGVVVRYAIGVARPTEAQVLP